MMASQIDGNAIIYCEGAFDTTCGKTAHGLVRRTRRYRVLSVLDSQFAGSDSGAILDGKPNGIPIKGRLAEAVADAKDRGTPATHLVIGIAPDGGHLDGTGRSTVCEAIRLGLNVDSGLHDFLSEDSEIAALAVKQGVRLRDVRKPPRREELHFFSGKIGEVRCLKIAVLGTDSAVGKRTTAWELVEAFEEAGRRAVLVGTGQTAWLQGARFSLVLDSLVNDFVAGEIEHAIHTAWNETRPDVIVIEGQGSLMHPAYPGGFEILAAGRPDVVVLQHASARREYDGVPGSVMHPLERQVEAVELLSGKPVAAITLSHEGLTPDGVRHESERIRREIGVPALDVLLDGAKPLLEILSPYLEVVTKRPHRD
jgi:uncharacterized NAD-dependent epimerase/dehydratase family protein